jgi:hypothetical protein
MHAKHPQEAVGGIHENSGQEDNTQLVQYILHSRPLDAECHESSLLELRDELGKLGKKLRC